jgi:hypothetical protein
MNLRNTKRLFRFTLFAVAFLFVVPFSMPQGPTANDPPTIPDAAQIVQAIEHHDVIQAKTLDRYHALRHYKVEYQGFMKHITASMDVELEYDVASGKNFKILSQGGSHTLCEKVLKRALDSEKDASHDKGSHALTPENYRFQLLGSEIVDGRTSYVLQVDPVSGSPYLYRGKIWVDAADDAVSRMEVQPAKNPSIWISQTLIHQTNSRIGDFWLPRQNQSETKVRVGGKAVMTIDYGPYEIAAPQSPQSVGDAYSELASRNLQTAVAR